MKSTLLFSGILAAVMTTFGLSALADGDEGDQGQCHHQDSGQNENEDCQGGDIDGSETLWATIVLSPTNDAPADAGGVARLISANVDGMVISSLSLCVTGLDVGTYDLSVIRKSDGSSVDLGQFVIGTQCQTNRAGGDDNQDGDNEDGDNEHDDHMGSSCCQGLLNCHRIELPSDLDPMDIAQILVSDTNGNALLVGDLVDASPSSSIRFKANVRIHNDANGRVAGKVIAAATVKRGRKTQHVTMLASGVAPSATFTVTVNGEPAGTVKSNRKGKVLVSKVPANLLVVRSIHLVDSNGQTAVHAKF